MSRKHWPKLGKMETRTFLFYVPLRKRKDSDLPVLFMCSVIVCLFVCFVISFATGIFLCTSLLSPLIEYASMFETSQCG